MSIHLGRERNRSWPYAPSTFTPVLQNPLGVHQEKVLSILQMTCATMGAKQATPEPTLGCIKNPARSIVVHHQFHIATLESHELSAYRNWCPRLGGQDHTPWEPLIVEDPRQEQESGGNIAHLKGYRCPNRNSSVLCPARRAGHLRSR